MTIVKICGITNVADAFCAAAAGADFLGFIFHPGSPRCVDAEVVRSIVRTIRARYGSQAPRSVGVFVNVAQERVKAIIDRVELDLVQLHGTESAGTILALHPYAYKALRPQTADDAAEAYAEYHTVWSAQSPYAPDLLVDAYHPGQMGGTGTRADAGIAAWLARRCRVMVAGGLTPDNVADAITDIRPWGVDVSSGVEAAKGLKDHARVRAFIEAVRTADVAIDRRSSVSSGIVEREAKNGANV